MLTPFQYVRMVLTAYSHLDQWFCEPCLGAAVRKVGGDVDSLTLHEVTEQIRGTKGMEYGVDRCPRCHSVTSLIRFAGSK